MDNPSWPILPYKGLNYYGPEDVVLFAGRESDVGQCANLLGQGSTRIVILHGSTGCGKSSFLRAGLIPLLEQGGFHFLQENNTAGVKALFVRSTDNPLAKLAETLFDFASQNHHIKTLLGSQTIDLSSALLGHINRIDFQQDAGTNADVMVNALSVLAKLWPKTLVFVIDQAEEVLTVKSGEEGNKYREQFFEFVAEFSRRKFDLKLLIALRTEFYGRFFYNIREDGADALNIRDYLLAEFNEEQMVKAIERPTLKKEVLSYGRPYDYYRFEYEGGTSNALDKPEEWGVARTVAHDLENTALAGGKLPVMQTVCANLYQTTKERADSKGDSHWIIKRSDYKELGGIEGQMASHVQRILEDLCNKHHVDDSKTQDEIGSWKEMLGTLVKTQVDGTVTTELKPAETLAKTAHEMGCTIPFDQGAAYLSNEDRRLLRSVDVIDARTKQLVHCYSLGHDVIGLVLRNRQEDVPDEELQKLQESAIRWQEALDAESVVAQWREAQKDKADKDGAKRPVTSEHWLLEGKSYIEGLRARLDKHRRFIHRRELIKRFLTASAELTERTELANAIRGGRASEISKLLKNNRELNREDVRRKRIDPVFYVAVTGDDEESLLEEPDTNKITGTRRMMGSILNSENINYTTLKKFTPLHLAAIAGQVGITRKILQLGMYPDIESVTGSTPLMYALAYEQGDEVARMLLSHGANPKKRSFDHWRPLLSAVSGGKLQLLKDLMQMDTDLESPTSEGASALIIAANKGHTEVAEYLLQQGARADVKLEQGWTPLGVASAGGHLGVVRLLLKHAKADEQVGPFKRTALMLAARNGHSDVVAILTQVCDLDAVDSRGRTALMCVIEATDTEGKDLAVEKKFEICNLLVEAGARIDILNTAGQTVVDYARQRQLDTLAEWLSHRLPEAGLSKVKARRRQEIQSRLNTSIAWPVAPYICAAWAEVEEARAVDILSRLAESALDSNRVPFALYYLVRRLRTAFLACLSGWHIYEALVDSHDDLPSATLIFLTDGENVELLDGSATVIEQLWKKGAIELGSIRAQEDYARLYCGAAYPRWRFGRLVEEIRQIPWKDGESNSQTESLPALVQIQLDPKSGNEQIIFNGTFLQDGDLFKVHLVIPGNSFDNEHTVQGALYLLPGSKAEQIAGSLSVHPEQFAGQVRRIEIMVVGKDQSENKLNTLVEAAREGDLPKVERLIADGGSIDERSFGETALIGASRNGHLNVVRLLLKKKADPHSISDTGETAVHAAASMGHEAVIQSLLDPLILAQANPHNYTASILLMLTANAHDGKTRTPLMLAAAAGHVGAVELLLNRGGQADREDAQGKTALFYAVEAGHKEVVELLIPRCDVRHESDNGDTPLSVCINSRVGKKAAIFDSLAAAGAVPDTTREVIPASAFQLDEATGSVVARAIETYSTLGNTVVWPVLPKLHDDWHSMPKERATEIASRIDELQVEKGTERMLTQYLILEMRSINMPFYHGWKLVEIMLQPIYRYKKMIVGCMVADADEIGSETRSGEKCVFLNGSPPIHELNSRVPIELVNEAAAIAYLRFFCSYVWGEEGGFWIVDDIESLPWLENADMEARATAEKIVRAPKLIESGEDGNKFSAIVLYARHLFEAQFLIKPTGMVEMLEDEPKTDVRLPLLIDRRREEYRIVE